MEKNLFIAEKPSVAMEFAKALGVRGEKKDGYVEDDKNIVTWCVGHLIEMSYPEKYDPDLKKWDMEDLPFLPDKYKYEPVSATKKQYNVVKGLLNRKDVSCIYYSGDSAREGEYIQRLVRMMAGRNPNAEERRVWIDSQTKEEILNGIRNAKPLSYYDGLSDSGYARAIEDYAVGINFSRAASLKYSKQVASSAGLNHTVIAVGRVMSCVLGMTVDREREIRNHVKTTYYAVSAEINGNISAKWKPKKDSSRYKPEDLYEERGFVNSALADQFIKSLPGEAVLTSASFKPVKKNAPLLFNLAELQSECTKKFHISPSETLEIAQTLYEKKLTTYPRTDARVLTTAVSKVIQKNISGLCGIPEVGTFANEILNTGSYTSIASTKYVNDGAVSDHYAIIPAGETAGMESLSQLQMNVYLLICRRFLSVFYPAAEYVKADAVFDADGETFACSGEDLAKKGWMEVAGISPDTSAAKSLIASLGQMQKGTSYPAVYQSDEKETDPPKRYTSGSMILAMENAGKLIDDEELREQIKGSGIGTSATRADTIKKLEKNGYIKTDKSQVIFPTFLGEEIYEVLSLCFPQVLSPKITANWEKGLSQVESKTISKDEYLEKLYDFVRASVQNVKENDSGEELGSRIESFRKFYKVQPSKAKSIPAGKNGEELVCPKCGKPLKMIPSGKYEGSLACSDKASCGFVLWNSWCGKKITAKNMELLLTKGETPEIKGFKSKAGKTFNAKLCLTEEYKIAPLFDK